MRPSVPPDTVLRRHRDLVVNLDISAPEEEPTDLSSWTRTDVADREAVDSALDQVHRAYGSPDVVIANAGISVRHGVLDLR